MEYDEFVEDPSRGTFTRAPTWTRRQQERTDVLEILGICVSSSSQHQEVVPRAQVGAHATTAPLNLRDRLPTN